MKRTDFSMTIFRIVLSDRMWAIANLFSSGTLAFIAMLLFLLQPRLYAYAFFNSSSHASAGARRNRLDRMRRRSASTGGI